MNGEHKKKIEKIIADLKGEIEQRMQQVHCLEQIIVGANAPVAAAEPSTQTAPKKRRGRPPKAKAAEPVTPKAPKKARKTHKPAVAGGKRMVKGAVALAAADALNKNGAPMRLNDLAKAVIANGFDSTVEKVYANLNVCLRKRTDLFVSGGRGIFALAEWKQAATATEPATGAAS